MSKFKVGDKVRVRKDLIVNKEYDCLRFINGMDVFCGEVSTVVLVDSTDDTYILGADRGYWFSEAMLEPAHNATIFEYDSKLGVYFLMCGDKTFCFKNAGVATKHPNDNYDAEIGKALAYKRYMESCDA